MAKPTCCKKCGKSEPEVRFYQTSGGGWRGACNECIAKQVAGSRRSNPKRYKTTRAIWREKNGERERETVRAWREANVDKVRGYYVKYVADPVRKKNKAARNEVWVQANRERVKKNSRAWHERNPDKVREKWQKRRALKAGAFDDCTVSQERELLEEYAGLCVYCLKPAAEFDHVVPLSRGGAHTKDNLVPACGKCNREKFNKPLLVFLATRKVA